jgi:hypothetical protein
VPSFILLLLLPSVSSFLLHFSSPLISFPYQTSAFFVIFLLESALLFFIPVWFLAEMAASDCSKEGGGVGFGRLKPWLGFVGSDGAGSSWLDWGDAASMEMAALVCYGG